MPDDVNTYTPGSPISTHQEPPLTRGVSHHPGSAGESRSSWSCHAVRDCRTGIDTLGAVTSWQPPYFDPLSTKDLTNIICARFEQEPLRDLADGLSRFEGSGLYAIYHYQGVDELYDPLNDYKIPVYVGQSRSHNSATGQPTTSSTPLWSRVRKHRRSIDGAANLVLADFGVRLLRLPDVHCDLGENGLRVGYQPVWNSILTGFGSNEQGSSTRSSAKSKWDTVHPGRDRTFGEETHQAQVLRVTIQQRVLLQIASFEQMPWRT